MFKNYEIIKLRRQGGITLSKDFRNLFRENDYLIEISLNKNDEIVLHQHNYLKQKLNDIQSVGSRKIASTGSLALPPKIIDFLSISPSDKLEIFKEQEHLVIRKYYENRCIVTGQVSNKNYRILNDKLVISKVGAELLLNEINDILISR